VRPREERHKGSTAPPLCELYPISPCSRFDVESSEFRLLYDFESLIPGGTRINEIRIRDNIVYASFEATSGLSNLASLDLRDNTLQIAVTDIPFHNFMVRDEERVLIINEEFLYEWELPGTPASITRVTDPGYSIAMHGEHVYWGEPSLIMSHRLP